MSLKEVEVARASVNTMEKSRCARSKWLLVYPDGGDVEAVVMRRTNGGRAKPSTSSGAKAPPLVAWLRDYLKALRRLGATTWLVATALERIQRVEHVLSTIDSRLAAIESERAPPSDRFYSCFEDRFRGSREEIRTRLSVYLPLLQQVAAGNPTFNAIDLGCGRGEWLQLLRDKGYAAVGVDTNDAQLENARLLGLDVKLEDALSYLRSREDSSIDVITSMHLLEHLPFAKVTDLLREIKRTLAPDGLLILETPNPQNLSVGAFTFHLDPTHNKPLPAELLRFLVERSGFVNPTIMPLHSDSRLDLAVSQGVDQAIAEMLFGPRDYALIAHGRG
jgi:SAM-dependent methyltransferase